MARQVIPLGAPGFLSTGGVNWAGLSASIDAAFIEGGAAATLARVHIRRAGAGSSFFRTNGPEMTPRWEVFGAAISLRVGPHRLTVGGPAAHDTAIPDVTEPYAWQYDFTEVEHIDNFLAQIIALTAAERADSELTLRDRIDIPLILELAMGIDRFSRPNLSGVFSDYRPVTPSDSVDNVGEDCIGLYVVSAGDIAALFRGQETSGITSFVVTDGGEGYTSVPTVTVLGGNGSGATGTAVLGARVTAVAVTAGGTAYTAPPAISFAGGGGSGAEAVAVLTAGVVTSVVVTNGGRGYTSAPTVTIAGAATGTATIGTADHVGSVTRTAAGSGYNTDPEVRFTGGGGSGAAARVTRVAVARTIPVLANAFVPGLFIRVHSTDTTATGIHALQG